MANITRPQVFNAADQISKAGQAPTVANVRAQLGSGSYTTITAMLREWKAQATPAEEKTPDVPEEVTDALERAAEIVWKAATSHFQQETQAIRKAAESSASEQAHAMNDALAEVLRLETDLAQCTENAEKYRKALEDTISRAEEEKAILQREQAQNGILRASLNAAQARIEEQADLLRRLTPTKKKAEPKDQSPQTEPKQAKLTT